MLARRLSITVLLLTAIVPEMAHAQSGLFHRRNRRLFDSCGPDCGAPALAPAPAPLIGDGCCAPAFTPQAVFAPPAECCVPLMPVIETCLVPQQCTTYRDIPQVCYRQEPVCQTVPVTTMKQVTVDEGCYQMVWVPKMVTKCVPETTYQQQMSYRTVAVPSVQRVAVTETRLVPQQQVRYVAPPCCDTGGCLPTGDAAFQGGFGPAPAPFPAGVPSQAPAGPAPVDLNGNAPRLPPSGLGGPNAYNPPSATAPVKPAPPAKDANAVVPQTTSAEDEWSAVERRAAFFRSEFGSRTFSGGVQQAGYSTGR